MTALTTQNSNLTIELLLEKGKEEISKALPKIIESDRFIRTALTEIRKNPSLQRCKPLSVCAAVMQAAQLGLEFGSALGQLYLIPYKDEATLMIGYRGLINLVRRSGKIKSIYAHCVYDGDFFEYELGTDPKIIHKPVGLQNQASITHAYAIAKLENDEIQMEVMTRQSIEYIRDTFSRGKSQDPWMKSFDEMARKTVLRRLIKTLPISTEVADALERDVDSVIEVREPEKIQKLTENTNSYVSKAESTAIMDELEKLCLKATELKVDIEDMPDDFTDQTALAWSQILKERIKSHESQLSNRGAN